MRTSSMCWLKRAFSLAGVRRSATMAWIFLSATSFCADMAMAGSMAGTPSTMVVDLGVVFFTMSSSVEPSPPHALNSSAVDIA